MIALDTNVLVRYLVEDDPRQTALAREAIEALTLAAPGFVSLIVLVELNWVLAEIYGVPPAQVSTVVQELLDAPGLVVERAETVAAALRRDGDLVDCLLHEVGQAHGCARTVTFDRKFARTPGVELLA